MRLTNHSLTTNPTNKGYINYNNLLNVKEKFIKN
ncbi:MAG: hypothetical protein KatS3mg035_1571 [Bacteroidia bacterium]|nr:MAG: hypothetical protein KatS3mg035_1571 [Bacteroidia bacterium]